jgi:hypothetical protein
VRFEWVPLSAAALVTGVMALVLGQTLNPGGSESSPAAQLVVAAESPGRWLAMSILFFGGAAAMALGMPAVMTLFEASRGRRVGSIGVAVLTVGCVGVGGLSALMLMFRTLAIAALSSPVGTQRQIALVTAALKDPALRVTLGVWVYGFLLGLLLVVIGLFRSPRVPVWIPTLLSAFLALQLALPVMGDGPEARVTSALALVLLAAGFTGIATRAAGVPGQGPVTHSLA